MIGEPRRWLLVAVGAALAVFGIGLVVHAALTDSGRRRAATQGTNTRQVVPPAGSASLSDFGDVGITVTSAAGTTEAWCALVARTDREHERGLMEVQDASLGGRDAMLFQFAEDETSGFWMRNTPMPLEIAYFDRQGDVVSTAVMAPCADEPTCPGYPPRSPYRSAIEVPRATGGLRRLGIVPGATLQVTTTCERPRPGRR